MMLEQAHWGGGGRNDHNGPVPIPTPVAQLEPEGGLLAKRLMRGLEISSQLDVTIP